MVKHRVYVGLILLALLLTGCSGKRPEITQQMVDFAKDVISGYDHVIEADAVIKDDVISLAIITSYAISEEYAKQLGDNFVRAMGAGAAIYNKKLNGPAADSYGGVYKHYTVHIGIYNVAEEDVAVGTMAKGASRIRWQ